MEKLTKEELTNRDRIKIILDNMNDKNLCYKIIPSGCHIEIQCMNPYTIYAIECSLSEYFTKQQLESIRGNVRITYNKFVK